MDSHDYAIHYNRLFHAHRDKIRDLETILYGQRFASFISKEEAKTELIKALRDYADFLENPPKKK